jgi:hypothetical protein
MTDPEDLARRDLILWAEYLAALLAEAAAAGPLGQGSGAGAVAAASGPAEDAPRRLPGPPAGAAPAAGAPGQRHDVVAELARRMADLEDRVAGIERGNGAAARPGRQNRGVRA